MSTAAVAVFAAALALCAVMYGVLSTGPNCPGMDPSYLGWCE